MAKINNERIRRANNARLKQYERLGVRLFMKALKEQAVENPSPLPMQEAYIEFYQTVFVDSAKREWNRIRMQEKNFIPSDFFLNTWKEWIKDWVINNLGFLITEVTETTRKKVQAILGDAVERGLNPFQTANLLLEEIPDIKRARAIARTESTRANNQGKEKSANDWANETGQQLYKLWIWGGSRDPRIEHVDLQNKPIRKEDNFIGINGKPLSKPGDMSGGPENTINCSCTVVYVSERFARRNYPEAFKGQPVGPDRLPIPESTKIDDELFFSMSDSETNRKTREILSGSDGVNEIINRDNTFVSLKPSKYAENGVQYHLELMGEEKFNEALNKGYLKKMASNLGQHSNGVAQMQNNYLSVRFDKGDVMEFKKVKTIFDSKGYDELKKQGFVEVSTDDGVRLLVPNKRGLTGQFFLSKHNVPKHWSVSEAYKDMNGKRNVATTLIHESGHAIQFGKDADRSIWKNLMQKNNIDLIEDSPTYYGGTNEMEFFAESYTSYIFDNDGLKLLNPKVFNLIEDYFKMLGIDKRTIRLAD